MRILLIGNFAPPYEEESISNIALVKRLRADGNECVVINVSETPPAEKDFIHSKGYVDFVLKLIRYAWKKDVIHFNTKGYLRLGLLKLMTSILIGRFFNARTVITLHSELFSIMGQMRSPVGGRQTLFTSFALAHKIICEDKDTYEVANIFKRRHNLVMIPSFICIPKDIKDHESNLLNKLKDKKRVVVFSNIRYPSFIFDVLDNLLNPSLNSDIGIIISISEKPSVKLQHVLEEKARRVSKDLIFIEGDNFLASLEAYRKTDLILRPLSCEGRTFFSGFTISIKKPICNSEYIYFPNSLLFVKEGEAANLCAHITHQLLMEKMEYMPQPEAEDFYRKLKDIYQGK
jgi:hypothetical protein